MLSALKKLTVSKQEYDHGNWHGLRTMPRTLQTKFSKGVQYNMKIIIKGDRNVGKSCLLSRLQGQGFRETYVPTEEIQVTSIQWSYKVTDDVVKVEVWDVVDRGKKRILSGNLKLDGKENREVVESPALDAEFLDVYKGTHGVIIMMDITKNWTFEYVQREIQKIPTQIPVLVLGNHCDMSHHRTTTPDHVLFYLETLQRKAPARYTESSMSNGFGLKFLHKWFNLPFLQLQRETFLAQLVTNEKEIDITTQELDLYEQTDDSDYNVYLEKLTNYRRKVAESNSVAPSSSIVIQTQHIFPACPLAKEEHSEIPKIENESATSRELDEKICVEGTQQVATSGVAREKPKLDNEERYVTVTAPTPVKTEATFIRNIEDFVPDDHLDKSFLEEASSNVTMNRVLSTHESESETELDRNPLVADFQYDLDPDDNFSVRKIDYKETMLDIVENLEDWMPEEPRGSPDGVDDHYKNSGIQKAEVSLRKNKKKKSPKAKSKSSKNSDFENFLNTDYEAL